MKTFYTILVLLFISVVPCFAKDIVQTKTSAINGKIVSYSDGVVNIESGGINYSIMRAKGPDVYSDYIIYRPKPFSATRVRTNCRIILVDLFSVVFQVQNTRLEIPRYRVSRLFIDTK